MYRTSDRLFTSTLLRRIGARPLSRAGLVAGVALACLALPARADLAGDLTTVLNKVKAIETKANRIVTSTNGIPALVENVSDVTAQFGTETIQDVMNALQDAKNMLEFLKARAANAGSDRVRTHTGRVAITCKE